MSERKWKPLDQKTIARAVREYKRARMRGPHISVVARSFRMPGGGQRDAIHIIASRHTKRQRVVGTITDAEMTADLN